MACVNIGDSFGALTVLDSNEERRASGGLKRMHRCTCQCGRVVNVERYNLTSGNTLRCTECAKNARGEKHKTHGHSISRKEIDPEGYRVYTVWQAMKRRCNNPKESHYARYGGRGIKVCAEWENSYETFLADIGMPPSAEYQIDRIDNDGNYCKENCRWVTRTENARNKSNNSAITAFGETLTLSAWSEKTGLKRELIAARLRRGIDPEKALSAATGDPLRRVYVTPLGEFASLREAGEAHGLKISATHSAFKKGREGWSVQDL